MPRRFAMALSMLTFLLAQPALGQSDDYGKAAVAKKLIGQAEQVEATQAKRAKLEKKQTTAVPFSVDEGGFDDVDALLSRLSDQNQSIIAEFEALLKKAPLNPDAPKWHLQIAEFHWQSEHYRYLSARRAWLAGLEACETEALQCPSEPQADYRNAIAAYREILQKYPDFEQIDEVLFRLGDGLIRNQQAKEGIGYLHRLTQSYPKYHALDAAYLAMGEYYFSQKNTGTAQAAYQKIIDDYPNSAFYQYAQYKLAWTYLNLADDESYLEAIALFKRVVESIDARHSAHLSADGYLDENQLAAGEMSFRNQALNDLSTTYVELPHGWQEAKSYLEAKLAPDNARLKLEQLGSILNSQAKFEEELALYDTLLIEDPLHPNAWDIRRRRVEAFEMSNRMVEAEAALRETLTSILPTAPWYEANVQQNPRAIAAAERYSIEQHYRLGMTAIMQANDAKEAEKRLSHYEDARLQIERLLTHYKGEPNPFDLTYTYAYVLDELSDAALFAYHKGRTSKSLDDAKQREALVAQLSLAASQYQKVIDWPKTNGDQGEQIQAAANRQVFVYANLLATTDPSWSIEQSSKVSQFVEERASSGRQEATALSGAEQAFVASVEQFAQRYPMAEESPGFLWRAAEIYRQHYAYEQAAQRFDDIITNFPNHQYAAVSVGSMFELYNKAENYEKIEYWAKWLIEKRNFKHYSAQALEDAAAYAIGMQAKAEHEKGELESAVATLMRVESSFPQRIDLSLAAILEAISLEEKRERYDLALTKLERAVSWNLPKADLVSLQYALALNATRLAYFDRAAEAFEFVARQVLGASSEAARQLELGSASQVSARKKSTLSDTRNYDEQVGAISDGERILAAQSVLYGGELLMALGHKKRAIALLEHYLFANRSGFFDVFQDANGMQLGHTDDVLELVMSSPKAMTMLASELCLADADTGLSRLKWLSERFALDDARAGQSARVANFAWARCALDQRSYVDLEGAMEALKAAKDVMSDFEKAQFAYLEGRRAALAFEAIELVFPIPKLRKSIEQKAKARQVAEAHFHRAIGYKSPQVSTAAAYALAEMALHFRDAFKALPIPESLFGDPEGLESYTLWLEDELIFPAEDAAASLLNIAQQITIQLQSYTDKSLASAKGLAILQPESYPLSAASLPLEFDAFAALDKPKGKQKLAE